MNKKKLLYLSYHTTPQFKHGQDNLNAFKFSYDVIHELKTKYAVSVIGFIANQDYFKRNSTDYYFRKKLVNNKLNSHYKTHRLIKQISPNIILFHGLLSTYQLLFLIPVLKHKPYVIVQHHAEQPPKSNIKRFVLKLANKYVSAYIFTSEIMASNWKAKNIISESTKILEQAELSTHFKHDASVKKDPNLFILVARLNANKNPELIVNAFINYLNKNPKAKLVMFYSKTDLLTNIKTLINSSNLSKHIILMGKVKHDTLEHWYQKSSYFLLGSFYEGGSAALIEAMACGCIPIVTDIPSNRAITKDGQVGILFNVDDQIHLEHQLESLDSLDTKTLSNDVITHFNTKLSFKALAEGFDTLVNEIIE